MKNRFINVPCAGLVERLERLNLYCNNVLPDLQKFIKRKEMYFLNKEDVDAKVALKFAYMDIYEDLKIEMHMDEITEDEFLTITGTLQEGL